MKHLFALLIFLGVFAFQTSAQHFVVLKNGTKLECVVISLNDDTLEVYVELKMQKIHLSDVSNIFFDQYIEYDGTMAEEDPYKTIQSGTFTIRYQMKDRTVAKAPPMSNATEKQGRVVVKIKIDRYGIVKDVKTGHVGSNTSDKYLLVKAMKAAQATRFSQHLKGPISQEGLMVFEY